MLKKLSFRTRIFLSQLLIFIILFLLLLFFIPKTVDKVMLNSLTNAADKLVSEMQGASTQDEMIDKLRKQNFIVIVRAMLFDSQGDLLYDSYSDRIHEFSGEKERYPLSEAVSEALRLGKGHTVEFSSALQENLINVAIAFIFQDKKYVTRVSFPYSTLQSLSHDFEFGFSLLFAFILFLFFIITWFIFHRASRPIHEIIQKIRTFKSEELEPLPKIELSSIHAEDDFGRLVATLNSMSERIQTQIRSITEERNEKEAILESLGEGVIAIDAQEQIRYVNFMASKMLGIPRRHLLYHPLSTFIGRESSPLLEKSLDLLKICQENRTVVTDSLAISTGRKRYFDLIAAPKSKGSGAILVLQDKSSHYKVLEMGKDFVANASHELRTPITIIRGFTETLQDLPEISQEMLADILEKIVRNCQRMESLVKNLLTLADIENLPEDRFKETDILFVIDNCIHTLLSLHPEVQIIVKKELEELYIASDPDLIELAISNLLDNAVKYSVPPAVITIQVEQLAEEAHIIISDKGIGIAAADLDHIFERFYTVSKARSRKLGGAGLGLSIVKTIIEKHDGSIAVASSLGEGTTFTILLPLYRH